MKVIKILMYILVSLFLLSGCNEMIDTEYEQNLGEVPLAEEDTTGKPITEEELLGYIKSNGLEVFDYKIISRYAALVLEVENGNEVSTYIIHRLQNGELESENGIITNECYGQDVFVKVSNGYLAAVILESGKQKKIEELRLIALDGEGQVHKENIMINDRQGLLIPLPKWDYVYGRVHFIGSEDYYEEKDFRM
ncbi:hypothetical protein [Paenibacillus marinisediminis]